MILPTLLILLHCLFPIILGETGCPPSETIAPCKCVKRPSTRLECANITFLDTFINVFKNSERYTYQEVHIESTFLMSLPEELFTYASLNELYIKSSGFNQLFHSLPKSSTLYKLYIDDVSLKMPINWNHLKNFTNLRTLTISRTRIKKIVSNFSKNLPESLKEITFIGTETRKIEKGAFGDLPDLDKVVFASSNLTNISRDIFPTPFNARFMYFDNSDIRTIADDFFLDMPNLQFLSLRNNSLAELNEVAFKGRTRNIPYVNLEGNPLKCDCLLVWLIRDKPEIIRGTCTTPSRLRGQKLQDLKPGDFNC